MENIVFAAAIIAAFLIGAYVRKPFAIIHKKAEVESPESVVNATEEEKEKNEIIREEMEKLLSYTGRKREGDAE